MSTRVAEVALTLVTAAFASYFLFDTWGHPVESRIISSFLAVVILVLAAAFLYGHVTGRSETSQPAATEPSDEEGDEGSRRGLIRLSTATVVSIAFIAVVRTAGLGLSLPPFMLAIYALSSPGRPSWSGSLTTLLTGVGLAYVSTSFFFQNLDLLP